MRSSTCNRAASSLRRRRCGLGILIAAAWIAFAGPLTAAGSDVARVQQRGKLVVLCFPDGTSPFLRTIPGGYEGVDVSVLRSFATKLGVTLEVREVRSFPDLMPALNRGEGDVAGGGFSITESRRKVVDFSRPYFPLSIQVIAHRAAGISGLAELAGKRAAAARGTTHEQMMAEMGIKPALTLARAGEAYAVLRRRQADFAFVDSTTGLVNLDSYPELMLVGMLPKADYYGYAMRRGSDLKPALDAHIAEIRRVGLLYRIFERYLGPKGIEMYELFKNTTPGAPLP
jgi:polar amino acid transport system substrate-binding protein